MSKAASSSKATSRARAAAGRQSANGSEARSAKSGERVDNVTRVYRDLRALIIKGQLPPGARISERAVVARMGLSRTPVRSALHRLQQEGFVGSVGRAGDQRLIVTPLTQSDGRELFHIVGHLEGMAAREAASLAPEARRRLIQRLKDANKKLGAAAKSPASVTRFFDMDTDFHRTYVEGVAGPRLVSLLRAIKPQAERYIRLYVNVLTDQINESVREHNVIISAISDGSADKAQAAVEHNWRNAAVRLTRMIDEHGERGIWHLLQGSSEF